MALVDSFGRVMRKLRVSVTDRCDLRCTYCMPAEGLNWLPKESILSFAEIERFVRVAVKLGVESLRLTGGEPLVRPDLRSLIQALRKIPELRKIGMTTNGVQLAQYAGELADAGLSSINVSLDSLEPQRFHQLTRRDALARVLEGIDSALKYFPGRVKINAVALRGFTELELDRLLSFAESKDITLRFIEYMPLDGDGLWDLEKVLPGAELLSKVRALRAIDEKTHSSRHSPAREFRFLSGRGGVGFINSVTEPFCASCDRIRLTADGRLRTCLFSYQETDLRAVLQSGSELDLQRVLRAAVYQKEPGHQIQSQTFLRVSRPMSQIGG